MTSAALSTYAQNSVTIESPYKLVEMLYEGILRFTAQAKKSIIEDGELIEWTYVETDHRTGKPGGQIMAHWDLHANKGG